MYFTPYGFAMREWLFAFKLCKNCPHTYIPTFHKEHSKFNAYRFLFLFWAQLQAQTHRPAIFVSPLAFAIFSFCHFATFLGSALSF